MKTYIFAIIERIKHLSKTLDAKTIMSNKEWSVFNDSGDKESMIFKENGKLHIIVNGVVSDANWEFEPTNNSLIITTTKEKVMVFPTFCDNNILVLKQDVKNTPQYAFLIDRNITKEFHPQTLSELQDYFEQLEIQEQKRIENELLAKKKAEELEKKRAIAKAIRDEKVEKKIRKILLFSVIFIVTSFVLYFIGNKILFYYWEKEKGYNYAVLKSKYWDVYNLTPYIYVAKGIEDFRPYYELYDLEGNLINFEDRYDEVGKIDVNGNFLVTMNGRYFILDSYGRKFPCDQGFYKVNLTSTGLYNCKMFELTYAYREKEEGWNYYDRYGNLLNKQYIKSENNLSNDINLLIYGKKYLCTVDKNFKVLKAGYELVENSDKNPYKNVFPVCKNGKCALVDSCLNMITPFVYDSFYISEDGITAEKDGKRGELHENGIWDGDSHDSD